MSVDIPIYLFAKAPQVGRVKTRLSPPLSPSEATEVAALLLERSIKILNQFWPGQVVLTVDPSADHPALQRLIKHYQLAVEVQIQADLGTRMAYVLQRGCQKSGGAAVVGTDIPALNQPILEAAYTAIKQGNNPIGPTLDGGFYLFGSHDFKPALFNDVNWGSAQVLSQVKANARHQLFDLQQLPPLQDLDDYDDLKAAAVECKVFQRFLS